MQASLFIRKSLFVSIVSTAIALLLCTIFLFREKGKMESQARQLIIQNDSIMSANIVLTDSLKKAALTEPSPNSSAVLKPGR